MTKYMKAELHANGETIKFDTGVEADRLRANFEANYFKTEDGTLEYGVNSEASTFVVLTLGEPPMLGEKPSCNNYCQCEGDCGSTPEEPVDPPETGE